MNDDQERRKCDICKSPLGVTWTDHHGIAQCAQCGAPYRIYHYEGEPKRRVDKPAELLLSGENLELARRFHSDTGRKLSAVGMALSFPGGYDIATKEDILAYREWSDQQEETA